MTAYKLHAERLQAGQSVEFRPHGNSMTPRIKSGQLVRIVPVHRPLETGDIVFCRVKGSFYVHLVKGVDNDGRPMIGNNHGHTNGWASQVYGICEKVSD